MARAGLQAPIEKQILTAHQMFTWADQNIDGIKFFFVSDDVNRNTHMYQLEECYSSSKTLSGTRSHHSFVPILEGALEMWQLSADEECTIISLGEQLSTFPDKSHPNTDDFQPGITCMCNQGWFIGSIE